MCQQVNNYFRACQAWSTITLAIISQIQSSYSLLPISLFCPVGCAGDELSQVTQ